MKSIVVPGTDVGRALEESFQAMEKQDRKKVIILITDGEDLEKRCEDRRGAGGNERRRVHHRRGHGSGAEIRVWNEQGQQEVVRDKDGGSSAAGWMNPLRAIARATKGDYQPLGPLGEGLAKVRLAVESKANLSGVARCASWGLIGFYLFADWRSCWGCWWWNR